MSVLRKILLSWKFLARTVAKNQGNRIVSNFLKEYRNYAEKLAVKFFFMKVWA